MAKYVLLEFDDDNDADSFIGTIQPSDFEVRIEAKAPTIRIKAVYKKPTQFCTCPNPGEKSVRGTRWGWWLHKECGKPKRGNWQTPRNLLEEDKPPRERVVTLSLVEGAARPNYLKAST